MARSKGYSEMARHLSRALGRPVSRQRVHAWATRSTVNAAGEKFPGMRDAAAIARWAQKGIPVGRHRNNS